MWTVSWTWGLVHNLVSIILNYTLDDLIFFEDNIDYFGL